MDCQHATRLEWADVCYCFDCGRELGIHHAGRDFDARSFVALRPGSFVDFLANEKATR